MTLFIHDQFAKDYLKELLSPLGEVETSRDVPGQVREIDVFFTPVSDITEYREELGLLGRLATNPAIFEPFRNAVNPSQIRGCMGKLFDVCAEFERRGKREETQPTQRELPRLFILTPTASKPLLDSFRAFPDQNNWLPGMYFLGEGQRTVIIVIHQLPRIPETLWLRILGKGNVQKEAIAEITALPEGSPLRNNALNLLYHLQANLAANQRLDREDRRLIVALAPLFQQKLEEAIQQGVQQGVQQGIQQGIQQGVQQGVEEGRQEGFQQGQHLIVENFLRIRFGELSDRILPLVEPLSSLPPAELSLLLLQFAQLSGDGQGIEQARRLVVETLLRFRFGALDEQLLGIVDSLLALPSPDLLSLLRELSQVSSDELLARFGE